MSILKRHSEKERDLKKKMRHAKIFEKDIRESFVLASGPGGQNVNKVATCVMLHHLPTGVKVKCQSERSQAMNRYIARRLLFEKITREVHEEKLKTIQKYEKRRRQTRKRPDSLKEEILRKKHLNSEKKEARRKIRVTKLDELD